MPALIGTLTGELTRPASPVRQWFEAELPHRQRVAQEFRQTVAQHICVEPPQPRSAGTSGSAFDYLLRFTLNPNGDAPLAAAGARLAAVASRNNREYRGFDWQGYVADVVQSARQSANFLDLRTGIEPKWRTIFAAVWVLALFTELTRRVPLVRSPLAELLEYPGYFDTKSALHAVSKDLPDVVISDLHALHMRAVEQLLPFIAERGQAGVVLGPDLSWAGLAADADLIAGKTLIEVKAAVMGRDRSGRPRYGLGVKLLYQVVAYALLAIIHGIEIKEIALFNARYAHLYRWSLAELLSDLAGRPVNTETVATHFQKCIEANYRH